YEFINLAFENQEVIKRFRNEIHYWESKTGKRVFPLDKINNSMKNIPERKKKLLKSLGYIK
ncbi:hypothetical protein KJA15_00015, partial [Patescibacteria group bacterium]|nr:hypothetical protein [Patescibacteria group bacterium]